MKQKIFFDASSLKQIACFRRFYNIVVQGLKAKESKDYKMAYGSAFHKFLENYYLCRPIKDCINIAADYYRPYNANVPAHPREFHTSGHLIKSCHEYIKQFPRVSLENEEIAIHPDDFQPHIDTNNRDTIEYKFSIKVYETDKYELILSGTIDLVCEYGGYKLILVDHKTTSTSIEYAENYFDEYALDIQTMLYSKVYKEGLNLAYYPSIIINGIFKKKPTQKAEKENIFDGVAFKRSAPISYSAEQMEIFNEWYNAMLADIKFSLDADFKYAYNNYNLAACQQAYGPCAFINVCKLPNNLQAGALEARFYKKEYNPLEFR